MDIIMNIILGTIGSIVATAILFLASILYKIGYKDEIRFNLTAARTAIYQIQNQHLFPEDYALVISQIDILHRCAFCIFRNLYPLSLLRDRNAKKMIITLLYDIIVVCEKAKYTTVGYNGLDEKEARLNSIHKFFYKYGPLDDRNYSTVLAQLDIIENLINGKTIKNSIIEAFGNLADEVPIEDLVCDGFFDINSFKQKYDKDMRRKCFSRDEIELLLRN